MILGEVLPLFRRRQRTLFRSRLHRTVVLGRYYIRRRAEVRGAADERLR
jgi:hypothetical protein